MIRLLLWCRQWEANKYHWQRLKASSNEFSKNQVNSLYFFTLFIDLPLVLFGFLKISECEIRMKLTAMICFVNWIGMCSLCCLFLWSVKHFSIPGITEHCNQKWIFKRWLSSLRKDITSVLQLVWRTPEQHNKSTLASISKTSAFKKLLFNHSIPLCDLEFHLLVPWVEHIKETSSTTSGPLEKDKKVVQPQALLLEAVISCG